MTGIAMGYPSVIADLLKELPLAPLGPGKPHQQMRDKLEALSSAFAPGANRDMAAACRAGLWLAFDFHDESHAISQDLTTVEGSYWHAILHRREPDASNAAYWFRRVGEHPIFETLAKEALALGLVSGSVRWNPYDFIDLCEKHRGTGGEQEMLLRRVQRREWELLFDWCFRHTGGANSAG
jgi:hypothetical protein